MMEQPLILDIKGNSLDDGPGIRSVVFMKGCPLSCQWCHNPESKSPNPELSFDADECVGCNNCLSVCSKHALNHNNPFYIDRTKCNLCFACADGCPAKALSRVGEKMCISDILARVLPDKPFFDVSGGGVTLSGGEATLFSEFAGALLKEFKANGIHTLVETCGQFSFDQFERLILPYADLVYYDLKLFDTALHKKYCGIGNERILANFVQLKKASAGGSFLLLPRTPLIPDITDTEENLIQIADYLQGLGVRESRLLPYNPTWKKKGKKLGIAIQTNNQVDQHWQSQEKIAQCKAIFTQRNIEV